ncbi:reverse transcriptase domain-containing protein [Tanacetum coccineum]
MLRDIDETFCTLRKLNMKLNPKKCTFGAVEGTFLGYMISPEGIKPCPDKKEAVLRLPSPRTIKEVQSLNGKLASLNKFLSKSAEKSLPLFKTLKKCIKKSDFHWTPEAEQAFRQLKKTLVGTTHAGSTQTKGGIDWPQAKLYPNGKASPSTGFRSQEVTKIIVCSVVAVGGDRGEVGNGSGAGLILTNPEGTEFTYALRFQFTASNNEAEYEALIAGLRIAAQMRVRNVHYARMTTIRGGQSHAAGILLANHASGCTGYDTQINPPYPWAHRTMIKSSHSDTPFSLTYGIEAIIPTEIRIPTYSTTVVDAMHNDEELWLNLNLLEERRKCAAIREAKVKLKITKYYNARVRGVTFRPGDFVYRSNKASHAMDGGKLGPK